MTMRKILLMSLMLICGLTIAMAQQAGGKKGAEIKFDKTTHNFGKFSESSPKVTCVFTYTNTGDAPLIINQAVASCGCTVPEYTKATESDIQRNGKVSRTFQEIHHCENKRCGRDDTPLCRG